MMDAWMCCVAKVAWKSFSYPHTPTQAFLADASDDVFQIRPHKDFIPAKGRDRILSLRLLTILPADDSISAAFSAGSSDSEPRNAYDFMRRRRDITGDPTAQRWNAAIRLSNYASISDSPLCVSRLIAKSPSTDGFLRI